jgi:hypothetical protein
VLEDAAVAAARSASRSRTCSSTSGEEGEVGEAELPPHRQSIRRFLSAQDGGLTDPTQQSLRTAHSVPSQASAAAHHHHPPVPSQTRRSRGARASILLHLRPPLLQFRVMHHSRGAALRMQKEEAELPHHPRARAGAARLLRPLRKWKERKAPMRPAAHPAIPHAR